VIEGRIISFCLFEKSFHVCRSSIISLGSADCFFYSDGSSGVFHCAASGDRRGPGERRKAKPESQGESSSQEKILRKIWGIEE